MAIDSKQQVTTTGIVGQKPDAIKAPNLSGMNKLFGKKPRQHNLLQKVQNLTDEDRTVLATVLSPSVSNVLKKLVPDLTPLLDEAGSAEENLIIPVSVAKNFAIKRYGGGDETEAVTNFITDLQEASSMDQQNVPPDTQLAETPESGMEETFERVDSGIDEGDTMQT
jgi:hypothetical protein